MGMSAAILAHQGGWDEALLVLAPIVVIVIALVVVKRRVDRMARPVDDAPSVHDNTDQHT
jgi:hypothetical protein